MKFEKTKLNGVVIITPNVYEDSRGYFFESFNQKEFDENIGQVDFVQDNESKSSYGTLRGLHYQLPPFAQSKLVRVSKGSVVVVVVDIREESETYGEHICVSLSDRNKAQLFIPAGFAHGFLSLRDETIFNYKVDQYYSKEHERGIIWNDESLNIDWIAKRILEKNLLISDKDLLLPNFGGDSI